MSENPNDNQDTQDSSTSVKVHVVKPQTEAGIKEELLKLSKADLVKLVMEREDSLTKLKEDLQATIETSTASLQAVENYAEDLGGRLDDLKKINDQDSQLVIILLLIMENFGLPSLMDAIEEKGTLFNANVMIALQSLERNYHSFFHLLIAERARQLQEEKSSQDPENDFLAWRNGLDPEFDEINEEVLDRIYKMIRG